MGDQAHGMGPSCAKWTKAPGTTPPCPYQVGQLGVLIRDVLYVYIN